MSCCTSTTVSLHHQQTSGIIPASHLTQLLCITGKSSFKRPGQHFKMLIIRHGVRVTKTDQEAFK